MINDGKVTGRHKGAIREENEKRILLAAEKIFAELGFKGATTGRIAAEAGVPKSNVHYYFGTKDAIYKLVMEDLCTTWLSAARRWEGDRCRRRPGPRGGEGAKGRQLPGKWARATPPGGSRTRARDPLSVDARRRRSRPTRSGAS